MSDLILSRMIELEKLMGNEEVKNDILLKYGFLAEALTEGTVPELLSINKETYRVILSNTVVNWLKTEQASGSPLFTKYVQKYPGIARLVSDDKLLNTILKAGDIQRNQFETFQDIQDGLKCFGVEAVQDIGDNIKFEDDEFEDMEFDGLFEDDEVEVDLLGDTGDTGDTEDSEDSELEVIREIWGSKIDTVIKSILEAYRTLYESGYGLVSPGGLLTNNGIIRSNTNGELSFYGERPIDIEVFNAIQSITGDQFSTFANPEKEINMVDILNSSNTITYTGQHLKYMFGHIRFCTHTDSLKRYMTKKKILLPSEAKKKDASELSEYTINDSETKIIKYSTMQGWIKETLENIFLKAYRDMGISSNITSEDIAMSNQINLELSKTLKNVIVVAERKKGVNTRLRICTDNSLDVRKLLTSLEKTLNVGESSLIKVRQIGEMENGVIDVNIIYNDKTYSQDSLFAYQVLDILEEQGIVPSWDNVILGKKEDGTIMTHNFKDTKNPIYGLYAGTRSGKGVMTLNLLASALADGCKVVYVDGKPELSATLGDLAWKDGLDACVFNGLEVNPSFGLENRGNCIRSSDRFASREHIPDNIFRTEDELITFLLTVQYFRGMELVIKMAKDRMDKCTPDDWMVAIFDECEQFASQEESINNILDKAYDRRKKAIDPNDPKGKAKINITTDPAAMFIDDYTMWREKLESEFVTCVKSAFGKGNITVFFVWQSSKFPNIYKNTSSMAAMVESSRGKMVKIMGKGAVEQGGSNDFGNATTLKEMRWYDSRFTGGVGGYFAMGGDIKSGMQVFRPFNIYSDSNGKDLIITNSAALGISKEELVGSQLDENFEVIHEVGFEGYTNKLLGRVGLTVSSQLNIGFNYANDAVLRLGLGPSLLDFIYNAHSFVGEKVLQDSSDELDFDMVKSMGDFQDEDDDILDFGDGLEDFEEDLPDDTVYTSGIDNLNMRAERIDPNSVQMRELAYQKQLIDAVRAQENVEYTDGIDSGRFRVSSDENINTQLKREYTSGIDNPSYAKEVIGREKLGNSLDGIRDCHVGQGFWEMDPETGQEILQCNGKKLTRKDLEELSNVLNMPINDSRTFENYGKTNRKRVIKDIGNDTEVIGLNAENSIEASLDDFDTAEKFNDILFKSLWGARWQFQKRWEAVLNSISKKISANMVTRITISSDNMFVNNKQIVMNNILGGNEDVRLEDIVEFKSLLKRFTQLKSLALDEEITQVLCERYPDDPVGELFRSSKTLQSIVFISNSWGKDSEKITRKMYLEDSNTSVVEDNTARAKMKSKMEAISASKNNRLKHKSPGYQSRVWESTKKFQGEAWGSVGKNLASNNPSLLKATTVSAAAIVALGVGGVFAGFGKVLSLFDK